MKNVCKKEKKMHLVSKQPYPKNSKLLQQEFEKLRNNEAAKQSVKDARKFINRKSGRKLK